MNDQPRPTHTVPDRDADPSRAALTPPTRRTAETDEMKELAGAAARQSAHLRTGRSSRRARSQSFVKLDPRHLVRNPVMFVVEVGASLTTFVTIHAGS